MLKSVARFSTGSHPAVLSSFCRHIRARSHAYTESSEKASGRWVIVNEIESYLEGPTITPRDMSVICWSAERMSLDDAHLWQVIFERIGTLKITSWSDIGSVLFSAARAYTRERSTFPERTLGSIQAWLGALMAESAKPSLVDLAQIYYSVSTMFPKFILNKHLQKKLIVALNDIPTHNDDEKIPTLSSCKEISLMWSACRIIKSQNVNPPPQLMSSLLEASRGLRNCEDFNQNKVAQLSEAIAVMNVKDPRAVYQIIHFVDKHKSKINHRNLFRIARSMSKLGVANDVLWKRIAARLEDPIGLKLSVQELEEFKNAFRLLKNNQRIMGILDLYIKTKVDESKYGGL
jgi:hypothetical protein